MSVRARRVALALLLTPALAVAQPVQPAGVGLTRAPQTAQSQAAQPDEADDNRWRVDRCLLGLGYHSVTKVTVAAAGGLRRGFDSRSVCVYGAAHLGMGGTRASIGSAVTLGSFGSALGVSGGLLRTFGNPAGDAVPSRTYVGGSVHVWPLLGVHTEIGAYSLVTRSGEAAQRLVTWAVGFGY